MMYQWLFYVVIAAIILWIANETKLIIWLDAHSGAIIAIATVVVAGLTVFLAKDSSRQAEITQGQLSVMQQELQAHLSVGYIHRLPVYTKDKTPIPTPKQMLGPMNFRLNVVNQGHSKAYDISIRFRDSLVQVVNEIPANTTCSRTRSAPEQEPIYPIDPDHARG